MSENLTYSFKVVRGDLLDSNEDYLMQQCNCLARNYHGLSKQVFMKYPKSNIYSMRKYGEKGEPGQIVVIGKVINLLGQYYPGGNKYGSLAANRMSYIKQCLLNKGLATVAEAIVKAVG